MRQKDRVSRSGRPGNPSISAVGHEALDQYADYRRNEEDHSSSTVRNYVSDLRQFAAWCAATWEEGQEAGQLFTPSSVSTPTVTRYRSYLQTVLKLRPASINRSLVTLKRYFSWAVETGQVARNPATVVKLVAQEAQPPRHLTDAEGRRLAPVLPPLPAQGRPRRHARRATLNAIFYLAPSGWRLALLTL